MISVTFPIINNNGHKIKSVELSSIQIRGRGRDDIYSITGVYRNAVGYDLNDKRDVFGGLNNLNFFEIDDETPIPGSLEKIYDILTRVDLAAKRKTIKATIKNGRKLIITTDWYSF